MDIDEVAFYVIKTYVLNISCFDIGCVTLEISIKRQEIVKATHATIEQEVEGTELGSK